MATCVIDPSLPATFRQDFRAAQLARDFDAVCRLLVNLFADAADRQIRRALLTRRFLDTDAFPAQARRAQRARALHAQVLGAFRKQAVLCACERLRAEGLDDYADALESGDYAALCW